MWRGRLRRECGDDGGIGAQSRPRSGPPRPPIGDVPSGRSFLHAEWRPTYQKDRSPAAPGRDDHVSGSPAVGPPRRLHGAARSATSRPPLGGSVASGFARSFSATADACRPTLVHRSRRRTARSSGDSRLSHEILVRPVDPDTAASEARLGARCPDGAGTADAPLARHRRALLERASDAQHDVRRVPARGPRIRTLDRLTGGRCPACRGAVPCPEQGAASGGKQEDRQDGDPSEHASHTPRRRGRPTRAGEPSAGVPWCRWLSRGTRAVRSGKPDCAVPARDPARTDHRRAWR